MQKSGMFKKIKGAVLKVGLFVGLTVFSFNVYADQIVAHVGTYSYLYNTVYASNSSARSVLVSLNQNLSTYGIATNGCDNNSSILQYSSTYANCTLANWYSDIDEYAGKSVFCFRTGDLCRKFSGIRTAIDNSINTNSKSVLTKGYYIANNGSVPMYMMTNTTSAKRLAYIANEEVFECTSTCPVNTGWTSHTKSDGSAYEQLMAKYCTTTGSCMNQSSGVQFRCPAAYYNKQGTSALVSGSGNLSKLTCLPCPVPTKRDGTVNCAVYNPTAGTGTNISYCTTSSGCESYDYKGDYIFTSYCSYTKPGTTEADILAEVKNIISNELEMDISDYPDTTLLGEGGLGIVSTESIANISAAIEEIYDVTQVQDYWSNYNTIGGIVDYLNYVLN